VVTTQRPHGLTTGRWRCDPDPAPAVLGPRGGACDHHTRPEPVHRAGGWPSSAASRRAPPASRAGQQQRIAIAKLHPVTGVPVVLIHLPARGSSGRRGGHRGLGDGRASRRLPCPRPPAHPGLPDPPDHLGVVICPRHRDLQRRVPGGDRVIASVGPPACGYLIRPGRRVRRDDPGQRRFLALADERTPSTRATAVAGQCPTVPRRTHSDRRRARP